MRCVGLMLLLALPVLAGDLEGTWQLTMEREVHWKPRICHAELTLKRVNRKWQGWIRWDVLMGGRRIRLSDVVVKSKRFSGRWDVEKWDVSMEARLDGEVLKGRCKWAGAGDWAFSAERRSREKPAEVIRFEKGLSFDGYFDRAEAEAVALDGAALDRMIVAAQRSDTDALLVLKDGRVVCERYFLGYSGPVHIMSVTKFVTSLAVAKLLEEGKIRSLDAPVSEWFDAFSKGAKAKVTLRHLLAHTSGLQHERLAHTLNKQDDKVRYVLGLPVLNPGAAVRYSNEGVALLSGIVAKAAGGPVDAYVDRTVFGPLGIRGWKWDRDRADHTITYAQLSLRARDLARIGQACLDGKIAPKVLASFARPGKQKTRGLIWRLWSDPQGYGHTGWLGQFLVVYPKQRLVGVRLRRARRGLDNRAFGFGAFPARLAEIAGG